MIEPLSILVDRSHTVSALLQRAAQPTACFVLAHGAGAGMTHAFMAEVAAALAPAGVSTLRYQFPYMEQGSRRPDPPALCHATVRAAVAAGRVVHPTLPLIAGGKSFGGRMTSQAQAAAPLPGVDALAFLGFPLHPPNQPSAKRADHLMKVDVPMLFLQGARDEFAEVTLLQPLIDALGPRATLHWVDAADHSFRVLKRSGRDAAEVMAELVRTFTTWVGRHTPGPQTRQ